MHSRATHLIWLLIAAAALALAVPLAQSANRSQDPEHAALTAAWQAYRGLPGGPPAASDPEQAALTAAWQAYRGLPGGPPAASDSEQAALTAAWPSYRGLPGGPPATPIANVTPAEVQIVRPGFDWGDAGIGAAMTAGIFLLGGAAALVMRRRHELAHPHH